VISEEMENETFIERPKRGRTWRARKAEDGSDECERGPLILRTDASSVKVSACIRPFRSDAFSEFMLTYINL